MPPCQLTILSEFEQAQTELVGTAVILTDGKAGTVESIWLDEIHGTVVSRLMAERVEELAQIDELTGVLNRRYIMRVLSDETARAHRSGHQAHDCAEISRAV